MNSGLTEAVARVTAAAPELADALERTALHVGVHGLSSEQCSVDASLAYEALEKAGRK